LKDERKPGLSLCNPVWHLPHCTLTCPITASEMVRPGLPAGCRGRYGVPVSNGWHLARMHGLAPLRRWCDIRSVASTSRNFLNMRLVSSYLPWPQLRKFYHTEAFDPLTRTCTRETRTPAWAVHAHRGSSTSNYELGIPLGG
jgi:hypothetical protein